MWPDSCLEMGRACQARCSGKAPCDSVLDGSVWPTGDTGSLQIKAQQSGHKTWHVCQCGWLTGQAPVTVIATPHGHGREQVSTVRQLLCMRVLLPHDFHQAVIRRLPGWDHIPHSPAIAGPHRTFQQLTLLSTVAWPIDGRDWAPLKRQLGMSYFHLIPDAGQLWSTGQEWVHLHSIRAKWKHSWVSDNLFPISEILHCNPPVSGVLIDTQCMQVARRSSAWTPMFLNSLHSAQISPKKVIILLTKFNIVLCSYF